jgi:hypothetical protein
MIAVVRASRPDGDEPRPGTPQEGAQAGKASTPGCSRAVQRDVAREEDDEDVRDPKGRIVFTYQGEFNFDEAYDVCFRALKVRTGRRTSRCSPASRPNPCGWRATDDRSHQLRGDGSRPMWSELNERVTFVRRTEQGDGVRGKVPEDVAMHVFQQCYQHLPQSPEVIYTPLFTENADLIVTTGYREELNLIMADIGFEVPEVPVKPDETDVQWAVNWLKTEVLGDFPFLDHNSDAIECREPSEANALGMILTPFMRRMIDGCTPVFFISKPTPGTGGTFLAKVPMILFDGEETAPLRYTQNEEEMQKALLATIMNAGSHLFYDDVKEFNSRSLLQSITAKRIGGRLLGASKTVERPNRFNWVATGNNPIVGTEMERRICWIRLNAKTADIQKRQYRHPDFEKFLLRERSTAVYAILTLIQNWIAKGEHPWRERKRASFEDWSEKVGGVLHAAGIEGFLDNRRTAGADMDEAAVRQFVREWLKKFAFERVMPAKLFEHASGMELDIIDGNNDDQKKQRFPKRLHTLDGRVFAIDGVDYMVANRL